MTINQSARIYAGNLLADIAVEHQIKGDAYLIVVEGALSVDGKKINKGDGAEITEINSMILRPLTDSQILLIEI